MPASDWPRLPSTLLSRAAATLRAIETRLSMSHCNLTSTLTPRWTTSEERSSISSLDRAYHQHKQITQHIMATVSLLNVNVRNNPAAFNAPYEFEITFECLEPLQKDLEWKLTYVGSATS